jgi:predicted alpha/beta hydrolase family esterase
MDSVTTLILPGLGNSGPGHWQSYWERQDPTCRRVLQTEWDAPRCADWVAGLDAAVAAEPVPVVLVAHSSACALVAHWARGAAPGAVACVRGALLVAPSDPEGPHYPAGPTGFGPVPLERLAFPSVVVASADDVYVSPELARAYADAWGSHFVDVGPAGHINAASGLGAWPAGYALLQGLRGAAGRSAHDD